VETQRRTAIADGGNVSVMNQVLQYSLVGASEVLASIGTMELFYDQVCLVFRCSSLAMQSISSLSIRADSFSSVWSRLPLKNHINISIFYIHG
jgi:dipeptide/tripeptide permease